MYRRIVLTLSLCNIRVSLEKEDASWLRVTGMIVDSSLQLLGYETDLPLNCVNFDRTYYGTDVVRSAVLYNNSPEQMRFVMVLNDTAEGQLKVGCVVQR